MIGIFKIDFTVRLNLTAVKNHPVRKTIIGLAVNHIEFAYILPLNAVLIFKGIFKMHFTGWSNLTTVENHTVGKIKL